MKRGGPLKRKAPLKARTALKSGGSLKRSVPKRRAASKKLTPIQRSAKGQPCDVRIPGVCCGDSSTVVLAHLNGGGMAMKHSDIHGAYACRTCHAWLDGQYAKTHTRAERNLIHLEAVVRTKIRMMEQELIIIKGAA